MTLDTHSAKASSLGWRLLLCAVAISTSVTTGYAANEPNPKDMTIGMWELNLAKSTFCVGQPPKRGSREIVDRGWGLIVTTSRGVNAAGETTFGQYVAKYDGQEYPANIDRQATESIVWKLVDPYRVEFFHKLGEKVVSTYVRVVSKDGKTMTQSVKRPGMTCEEVQWFERQ